MRQKVHSNQNAKLGITQKVIDEFKVKLLANYDEKSGMYVDVFQKSPFGTVVYTSINQEDKAWILAYLNRGKPYSACELNKQFGVSTHTSGDPSYKVWHIPEKYILEHLPSFLKD